MSKERAQRRAEREREAAVAAAARAAEAERKQRRDARMQAVTSRLPRALFRRRKRPGGIIAQRRRRQTSLLIAVLVFVNIAVWVVSSDWALRLGVLVVCVLTAPVLNTLLFRRR
jgi:Flp pilus assembly protein TadB